MKHILIAGGTGFLGQTLARHFTRKGCVVTTLTRDPNAKVDIGKILHWDGKTLGAWTDEIEKTDVLINLCGKSVNCRYHERNRNLILNSRLEPTRALAQAIKLAKDPPQVWINASSSTIYAHSLDESNDEVTGKIGEGFSVEVCKAWEAAFFETELPHTRRVALRASMTLGHAKNSVFPILKRITSLGMGGKMSRGNQMVSWIHELDFARAASFIVDDETIEGPINITAPAPVTNVVFQSKLREAIGNPFGLNHYKPLLEIAAWLMRTETELMLKSRFVYPRTLLEHRFVFLYPFVDEAFNALVAKKNIPYWEAVLEQ